MVSQEEIKAAALDFLKAVAEKAKAELGSRLIRPQSSSWIVKTGSNSWSTKTSTRQVLNQWEIDMMYQSKMPAEGLSEQQRLEEALSKAGIPANEQHFGFFLPLIRHWLDLPNPFAFEEIGLSRLVEEFIAAVVDRKVVVKICDAIGSDFQGISGIVTERVDLDKDICIRPITQQELWQFGEYGGVPTILSFGSRARRIAEHMLLFETMPSEGWSILDIKIKRSIKGLGQVDIMRTTSAILAIRDAALVALRLLSSNYLRITPLAIEVNYGLPGIPRGKVVVAELSRKYDSYALDKEGMQRLKGSWPKLRQIVESQDHYLKLPAMRLLDGGGREREEDAIIDYAIGLEALLLTEEEQGELRYRFALRGATVLAWKGGDKKKFFNELRDFYDVRSKIVHGSYGKKSKKSLSPERLNKVCSLGEKALMEIWWWYFEQKSDSSKKVIGIIDERILS